MWFNKAAVNGLLELIVLGWMGVAGLRATGGPGKGAGQYGGREEGLIVGMPAGQASPKLF